jgi:hypothetical protein
VAKISKLGWNKSNLTKVFRKKGKCPFGVGCFILRRRFYKKRDTS